MIIGVFVFIAFIAFSFFYFIKTAEILIPFTIVSILVGVFWENRKISESWIKTISLALGSFIMVLFGFIPRTSSYPFDFEFIMRYWPYGFIFFFLFLSALAYKNKIKLELNEGLIFIQSIAMIYWIIDKRLMMSSDIITILFVISSFALCFNTFLHAFIKIRLSTPHRIILSIWSSIIMVSISVDFFVTTFKNQNIMTADNLIDGLYFCTHYFLLGIASVHILINILMIFMILLSKNRKFLYDFGEFYYDNIEKISLFQSRFFHSLVLLIIIGLLFILNYLFSIIPRNFSIWLIFFLSFYFLSYFEKCKTKTTPNSGHVP